MHTQHLCLRPCQVWAQLSEVRNKPLRSLVHILIIDIYELKEKKAIVGTNFILYKTAEVVFYILFFKTINDILFHWKPCSIRVFFFNKLYDQQGSKKLKGNKYMSSGLN